ncbi:MAG: UDP-N-acetylmuramate--L-alanine ligase, partial [Legionellales bacterium]|nr:UDP-N-acetylmuramate--L-alanine ligase [Legionellales bacterium]
METYGDSSEMQDRSFLDFIHKTPFYGNAVVCGDDPRIKLILNDISRKFFTYGMEPQNDLQAYNVEHYGLVTKFSVKRKDLPPLHITLNMPGRHNILNSLAAIAVATICKIPDVNICNALKSFSGIGRRFQIIGNYTQDDKSFVVIDDYGHHPTELEATIETARTVYKNNKITMVFQPHRYSRTKELWADFVNVLAKVDNLLLLDIYPGSESPIDGITSEHLVLDVQKKCKAIVTYTTADDLYDELLSNVADNGVVLCQGAGSVSKICRMLVASLQNEAVEL